MSVATPSELRFVSRSVRVRPIGDGRWVARLDDGHVAEIFPEHLVTLAASSLPGGTTVNALAPILGGPDRARALLEESEQIGLVLLDTPLGPLRAAPALAGGVGRSGGKLLGFLLSAHSRIWCPPLNFVGAHSATFAWDRRSAVTFAGLGLHHASMKAMVRSVSDDLYRAYARRQGKPRLVHVSLMINGHFTGFLDELYQRQARWIFVWRHAMDQIDSACRSFYDVGQLARFFIADVHANGGAPHIPLARFWTAAVRRQLEFQRLHPERVLVVKYEDLSEYPERTLKTVLSFLGEEWEDGMLERAFRQKHSMGQVDQGHEIEGTRRVEKDRRDRWHRWPRALALQVAPIVNETLEEVGYERVRV